MAEPRNETPVIIGILNVTPDSFSDGGRFDSVDDAVEYGVELFEAGAGIVDVGGESTRPGAERIAEDEEQERVIPVIEALTARGVAVSVDTMRASTAALAVQAGASVVNDVSGGLADEEMFRFVANSDIDYVVMHWTSFDHVRPDYADVVTDVRSHLRSRLAELIVWGVDPARVIVDPGLGFAKTADDNWRLLGHLAELTTLGPRVLIGASRKRFLAPFAPDDAPTSERDSATATISALAATAGAWAVRVHDVQSTRAALDVWRAWNDGASS